MVKTNAPRIRSDAEENMTKEETERSDMPARWRLPLGYFECKRAIKTLRTFQDLVRHHMNDGLHLRFAQPLEELPPPQNLWAVQRPVRT